MDKLYNKWKQTLLYSYYNTTAKLIHSRKTSKEFELCTFWEYDEQILPPKNTQICKIISGGTVLTQLQRTVFQNKGQAIDPSRECFKIINRESDTDKNQQV